MSSQQPAAVLRRAARAQPDARLDPSSRARLIPALVMPLLHRTLGRALQIPTRYACQPQASPWVTLFARTSRKALHTSPQPSAPQPLVQADPFTGSQNNFDIRGDDAGEPKESSKGKGKGGSAWLPGIESALATGAGEDLQDR